MELLERALDLENIVDRAELVRRECSHHLSSSGESSHGLFGSLLDLENRYWATFSRVEEVLRSLKVAESRS